MVLWHKKWNIFLQMGCPAPGIKQNVTSVRLAVPNQEAVDKEKIGDTKNETLCRTENRLLKPFFV
jgi:hypothetical protein